MNEQRKDSDQHLDASRHPEHTHHAPATPHQPARDDSAKQKQHDSHTPAITLDVMQRKQFRITHQITIRARKHVDRQLIEAQQARRGNLHARLKAQRREQRDDFDVLDDSADVLEIRDAVVVVRDQISRDDAGGDED